MSGADLPAIQSVRLPTDRTAVLVLDVNAECEDPKAKSHELLNRLGAFLQRARQSNIPIIYTISLTRRGTDLGKVAAPLAYRDDEPILYPDAFDKFVGGELAELLNRRGVRNLVIVGRSTNVAVMYTTTSAVRVHKYNVVFPVDGVNADSDYEHHYALHQLNHLPKRVTVPITFTALDEITFNQD